MRVKIIILTLLVGLLAPTSLLAYPGMPETVSPAQETIVIIVTTADLRVRAQPRTQSPSLHIIPQGTAIRPIGRNADTTWLQVAYEGVVGWVSVVFVATSDDLTGLPITDASDPSVDPRPEEQVTAPDGTVVPTGQVIVFSATSNVNVRALPDEGAPRLGQLRRNQRAVVTLLDPTYLWGRISFEGQNGWVALYVVNVLGDVRTVEVLGDPNTSSDLPIAGGAVNNEPQRTAIQNAQNHLARFRPAASSLIDIFSNGAGSGFIACAPEVAFFSPYRPLASDFVLVPELEAIVNRMNEGFDIINRARAGWVGACSANQTLLFRDQFPIWLAQAQEGAAVLDEVQRSLAVLATE